MMPSFREPATRLVAAAHRAARHYQLMQCSSGNISCRADDQHVLISASRTWLADLTLDQLAICRLADGTVLNELTASVESRFHLGTLRARPEVNAVLHFQSPFATIIACGDPTAHTFHMVPEIPYYIGEIGYVPYRFPGTEALADVVVEQLRTHNLVVLQNHGMVTTAPTLDLAIQNAVFFEMACRIIVQGGAQVAPLTPDAIAELRDASAV